MCDPPQRTMSRERLVHLDALLAVPVVDLSLVRLGKRRVRHRNLAELFSLVGILVWVIFQRELSVAAHTGACELDRT